MPIRSHQSCHLLCNRQNKCVDRFQPGPRYIQTCFYDGLDAYAMTWLQFAFPIYLSVIVGVMIVTSRQYTVAARIFGTANAPRALATLFLLSYAKRQRTIITITSFTFLTYPNGTDIPVWLSDGNVPYLSVKHLPLFITGILALVCLAIPYTIVLVCIQCLLKTHTRCLRWIRRLKPVVDAYTGPYKDKYRFWTGLLLVIRSILFAFNVLGDPTVNLLAIALTVNLLAIALTVNLLAIALTVNLLAIALTVNLLAIALTVNLLAIALTVNLLAIALTVNLLAIALHDCEPPCYCLDCEPPCYCLDCEPPCYCLDCEPPCYCLDCEPLCYCLD